MSYHAIDEQDLSYLASIVAKDRISTGQSNLDLHSQDMSRHAACAPEVVVWPTATEEVSKILAYANRLRIPVTGWGAGSSLEGNPIPVQGGIVLSFSRMDRILEIRPEDFQVQVQPGVIYKELNKELRHTGLFFPPDPGAGATIGGMIANNASGTRTVRYGSTKDYVQKMDVVLASGEVMTIGNHAPKSSSGYDLVHLMVGSEGTLGIVTEATLKLAGISEESASALATFGDIDSAAQAVLDVRRSGADPAMLELMPPECIRLINNETGMDLKGETTLFMEFHGTARKHLAEVLDMVQDICDMHGSLQFRQGLERKERDQILEARHAMGEMIRRAHPDHSSMVVDVAVPVSAYPQMIAFARAQAQTVDTELAYVFGHAGDGNIHLVIGTDDKSGQQWPHIHDANRRIVAKAIELGGTATGEHGVGIGKSKFMPLEHEGALEWMQKIKHLFDPNGILNPGKIFPG